MAPKGRPGCSLDVEELGTVFESHGLTQLKAGAFQAVNVCTVHSDHVSLFKTLLGITRALNAKAVADALPAPRLTAEQKRIVAKNLCHAFSDLLQKERNFLRRGVVPRPHGVYEQIFEGSQLHDLSHDEASEDDEEPDQNLLKRAETISDAEEPVSLLELGASSSSSAPQPLIPATL